MLCCFNILPAPLQFCMGLCLKQDVTEEGKKAKLQSSRIEQDLSEQAKTETNAIKILLLGTAESGKSTLIRQIKIIHSQGFSKQELLSFKPAVLDNLLTSMKIVLRGMGMLRINLANKNNKVHARSILSCSQCLGEDQELRPFVAHAFCALWADQGVRAAASRGYEFDLNDSALYFFENLSRIISPTYIPSEADVLRVRVRTCGIIETQFQVNDVIFRSLISGILRMAHSTNHHAIVKDTRIKILHADAYLELLQKLLSNATLRAQSHQACRGINALMSMTAAIFWPHWGLVTCVVKTLSLSVLYDVGGQRSERRKWLSCFDCIQAVLFVVALSSYDTSLPSMNMLQESVELFKSICNNVIFNNTSLILFMNKTDLFTEKILNSGRHLRFYLPSYTGADSDVDAAAIYITTMFLSCNTDRDKPVYHHFTTATDRTNMQVVLQMFTDQILKENLAAVQLL